MTPWKAGTVRDAEFRFRCSRLTILIVAAVRKQLRNEQVSDFNEICKAKAEEERKTTYRHRHVCDYCMTSYCIEHPKGSSCPNKNTKKQRRSLESRSETTKSSLDRSSGAAFALFWCDLAELGFSVLRNCD